MRRTSVQETVCYCFKYFRTTSLQRPRR